MNKPELSQQSLNPSSQGHGHHPQATSLKKSRQRQLSISKQNDSKHMNAIRPYVNQVKERKVSKRDSQKNLPTSSPYINQSQSALINVYESGGKNKSKKSDTAVKKQAQQSILNGKNIGDLYSELVNIKAEYKTLKSSYNGLLKQKNELTERGQRQAMNISQIRSQMQRLKKQQQKSKQHTKFMQQQIERMKKQCLRMIESQKFKNKKLEETLQQKQLMIAYLRSQLSVLNGEVGTNTAFFFQHTAPTYLKGSKLNEVNYSRNIDSNEKQIKNEESILKSEAINIQNCSDIELSPIRYEPGSAFLPCMQKVNNIPRPTTNSISNYNNLSNVSNRFMDMPKQIHNKVNNNAVQLKNQIIKQHSYLPQQQPSNNRREYIFSNEDDSLNFSYQKSRQSIKQQQHDSAHSSSDPTVLTFTKKDVYVLDDINMHNSSGTEHNFQESDDIDVDIEANADVDDQEMYSQSSIEKHTSNIVIEHSWNKGDQGKSRNKRNHRSKQEGIRKRQNRLSIEHNQKQQHHHANQQKSSYTGQQQIMTFQNRGQQNPHQKLIQLLNPNIMKQKKKKSDNETRQHQHKQKQKHQKQKVNHGVHHGNHHSNQQYHPHGHLELDKKGQNASKNKILTKRLQINTEQVCGDLAENKEQSTETRKKSGQTANSSFKTGRKKLTNKRKSQQSGSLIKK